MKLRCRSSWGQDWVKLSEDVELIRRWKTKEGIEMVRVKDSNGVEHDTLAHYFNKVIEPSDSQKTIDGDGK